jgi:hypothetical protein
MRNKLQHFDDVGVVEEFLVATSLPFTSFGMTNAFLSFGEDT